MPRRIMSAFRGLKPRAKRRPCVYSPTGWSHKVEVKWWPVENSQDRDFLSRLFTEIQIEMLIKFVGCESWMPMPFLGEAF